MIEDKTFVVSFIKNIGFCVQDKDSYKIYKMETLDKQQINLVYQVLTKQDCKIVDTTISRGE